MSESEKNTSPFERLQNAADMKGALVFYNEYSRKVDIYGLLELQRRMSEKLLQLGHAELAAQFSILAGQTENAAIQVANVNKFTDGIDELNKIAYKLPDSLGEVGENLVRGLNGVASSFDDSSRQFYQSANNFSEAVAATRRGY